MEREICTNFALHITVTDNIQINDLNKSIATGLHYVCSEFDAFSTLAPREMWISNPRG